MFQFFHLCDHEIKRKAQEPSLHEIALKNSGKATDVVIDGGVVVSIESVKALTYTPRITRDEFEYDNTQDDHRYEDSDPEDGYYDGAEKFFVDYSRFFEGNNGVSEILPREFYEPFLHNRIRWLVEPPLTYLVEAKVLFSNNKTEIYTLLNCPQCQGHGWFVDILDTKGRFSKASGIMRIAQSFIKDLLTEYQSNVLNLQYGTLLNSTISSSAKDDEVIFDDIRMIISEVEDRYLLRQQDQYDALAEDERLVKLWVRNITRSPRDFRKIIIEIQIQTEENEQTFRFSL